MWRKTLSSYECCVSGMKKNFAGRTRKWKISIKTRRKWKKRRVWDRKRRVRRSQLHQAVDDRWTGMFSSPILSWRWRTNRETIYHSLFKLYHERINNKQTYPILEIRTTYNVRHRKTVVSLTINSLCFAVPRPGRKWWRYEGIFKLSWQVAQRRLHFMHPHRVKFAGDVSAIRHTQSRFECAGSRCRQYPGALLT